MRIDIAGTVVEFVAVPPGDFVMGSANDLFAEAPAHAVRLRSGFLLGKCPVTRAQWHAVMGDDPSAFRDSPDLPVECVTWDRAVEFCRRLSERIGARVRLPSEAEWECACRAGTTSDFFFDAAGPFLDDTEVPQKVQRTLRDHAWFDGNSSDRTHPVGAKRPNPWGLHDMIGNVWAWCADVWHGDYIGAPEDGSPWLDGQDQQPRRCVRGGAWDMNAFRCRSPYRSFDHGAAATSRLGFRVAMDIPPRLRSP
jgi:eukaryotic-like serine/threonine-protein kinase